MHSAKYADISAVTDYQGKQFLEQVVSATYIAPLMIILFITVRSEIE